VKQISIDSERFVLHENKLLIDFVDSIAVKYCDLLCGDIVVLPKNVEALGDSCFSTMPQRQKANLEEIDARSLSFGQIATCCHSKVRHENFRTIFC